VLGLGFEFGLLFDLLYALTIDAHLSYSQGLSGQTELKFPALADRIIFCD
jgi:hypothetical protein